MVTKKQLAALARGRAIRKQQLKNRKTTRKTTRKTYKNKKRTKSFFESLSKAGKNLKEFTDVLGGVFAPVGMLINGLEMGIRGKKALQEIFKDERTIDTSKMKGIIKNMRTRLIERDPDFRNSPIYEKLDEIYKSLLFIELLVKAGQDSKAQDEMTKMLYLFSRVLEEYNRIVGN